MDKCENALAGMD